MSNLSVWSRSLSQSRLEPQATNHHSHDSVPLIQCRGADGAEIILRLGAGAEII